jgi:hypothetical protein
MRGKGFKALGGPCIDFYIDMLGEPIREEANIGASVEAFGVSKKLSEEVKTHKIGYLRYRAPNNLWYRALKLA